MNSSKVVLGVLAGVAVGALAGILFAPEKGSRTRKKILRKGEDSLDDLTDRFENLLEKFTDKYEDTSHDLEKLISKGKHRYEDLKKEAKM